MKMKRQQDGEDGKDDKKAENNKGNEEEQENKDKEDEDEKKEHIAEQTLNGLYMLNNVQMQGRNKLIDDIVNNNNNQLFFMLESCYYGLVVDVYCGGFFFHLWRPHGHNNQLLRFTPLNDNSTYGTLQFKQHPDYYLTVIPETSTVECKSKNLNDNNNHQLWKFVPVRTNYQSGMWFRIISKSGFALMMDWKNVPRRTAVIPERSACVRATSSFPDNLCRDLWSPTLPDITQKSLYMSENGLTGKLDMVSVSTKYRFWNIPNDGTKIFPKKIDTYKDTVERIKSLYLKYSK